MEENGRFSKAISEDVKGKDKSRSSEKKLIQRGLNRLFGSHNKHSKNVSRIHWGDTIKGVDKNI